MLGFSPLAALPLGDDGGAINYELTTVSITTGAPSVDAPQITQNHQLTSVSITTGAPVVDSPSASQNYSLTSTDIVTGAPLVGELYTVTSYSATASGLFDSTAQNQVDIYSSNAITANSYFWVDPKIASNITVNSTGISFRIYTVRYRVVSGNYTFQDYPYVDITLNWSGSSPLTVSSTSTASSLPSTYYQIDQTSSSVTNNALDFIDDINTAITSASQGSNVYDWIPSEVTATLSGNLASPDGSGSGQGIRTINARLSGSTTNLDDYSFSSAAILSQNSADRSTKGFNDDDTGLTHHLVIAGRFLFATYGASPYGSKISNFSSNSNDNTETGFAGMRFDRAVQTVQVRGAEIQVSEAFPTQEITAGAPIIDAPTLSQNYDLSGVSITTSAPVVDQSALSITVNFTSTSITTAAPLVDTTDLEQDHALQPVEITTSAPVIDGSDISQDHVLTGAISVGAPIVDQPVISQHFDLTTISITTGAPSIDAPTAGVTHNLTSSDITSNAPVIDTTGLSQTHNLQPAFTISSPIVDSAGITQNHVLTSISITTGAPVIDQPGDNWVAFPDPVADPNFWSEQAPTIDAANFWSDAA